MLPKTRKINISIYFYHQARHLLKWKKKQGNESAIITNKERGSHGSIERKRRTCAKKSPRAHPTREVNALAVKGVLSRASLYAAQPGTAPPLTWSGSRKRGLWEAASFWKAGLIAAALFLVGFGWKALTAKREETRVRRDRSFIFTFDSVCNNVVEFGDEGEKKGSAMGDRRKVKSRCQGAMSKSEADATAYLFLGSFKESFASSAQSGSIPRKYSVDSTCPKKSTSLLLGTNQNAGADKKETKIFLNVTHVQPSTCERHQPALINPSQNL